VFSERTTVGLDVHARSVVACGIDTVTGELLRRRLCPAHGEVLGWLSQLPGPVAVVYEAGPSGFGLARAVRAAGVRCEVAAPSKLQRPAGDRDKTDKAVTRSLHETAASFGRALCDAAPLTMQRRHVRATDTHSHFHHTK
jgi:transposase